MKFDIFFSISHTPAAQRLPSEREMFENFFDQARWADNLGFGTAWVAESHLSTEVQKSNPNPVVPHWQGEIGLNVDITQMAHRIFCETENIHVGSAVMNILCNGGPIAAAERVAYCLALHGMMPGESRKLRIGFAQGRFDFMNRAYGIKPKEDWQKLAWPAIKNKIFSEATEIFLRLLKGEILSSNQIEPRYLTAQDFKDQAVWENVVQQWGGHGDRIDLQRQWEFESLKIVPQNFPKELLELFIGTHDPNLQDFANQFLPVRVFNLSITSPEVIEATHERMHHSFHPDGGPWRREYMPRTVMVFINDEPGLTPAEKSRRAHQEAQEALSEYWKALEGTIDPEKVTRAAHNAIIGNPDEICQQLQERFHQDDRLMLWFDFFNHDSARIKRNMQAFMSNVGSQLTP